jgi:polyhydroxyalkanoate synthase subunit PhaE
MSTPFTAGPFRPDAMFAGAAAGFYELLKAFGAHTGAAAGAPPDFSSLARALGAQFEQWLKSSQLSGPSLWGIPPTAAAGGLAPGPAFASAPDARAAWDLLVRLAQLQAQLGAQWGEIASQCAQRFAARAAAAGAGIAGAGALTPDGALKLYELWVDCAEEAYAARVRTDEFASLQAQLANTTAELLLLQRRQAEQIARAWGLPTREELDGLERQLQELRAELEQSEARRAPSARRPPKPRPRAAAKRRTARRRGRGPRA